MSDSTAKQSLRNVRVGKDVKLYDFIRMLDADGYPQAFLVWRGYRFEFHDAKLEKETLTTKVKITKEVRR